MEVTETLSQGLKREYNVVVSAGDLATKLDTQLADLKAKVRINGFRPGKVPTAHLKKVYGRSVMADLLQETITAAHKEIVSANGLRLAMEPKVELPTEKEVIEAALEARGDLAFKVAMEVLPQFDVGDLSEIALERPVADVEDGEIEMQISRLADNRRKFTDRDEGQHAQKGDRVTVDFVGAIDGEAFEGGTGADIAVILGSNTFIPGFEDALLGARVGDTPTVKATFPENYSVARLAGKTGDFAVTVKGVAYPEPLEIDDEFAKGLGLDSIEDLRKTLRERLEAEYARASREKVKRRLLDALAERYLFEVPEGLVEQEFEQVWSQVEREQKSSGGSFADEGATEETARAEYRSIAQRRVRLGLVLADVGTKAGVQISEEELTGALIAAARAYPGQEKEIWDFYRNNAQALASLRAPIFEEKVVDHILGLAKVAEKRVSREELMKAEDEPEGLTPARELESAEVDSPVTE